LIAKSQDNWRYISQEFFSRHISAIELCKKLNFPAVEFSNSISFFFIHIRCGFPDRNAGIQLPDYLRKKP